MNPSDKRNEEVAAGSVPWNVEECIDLLQFQSRLSGTPKDDWDLKDRRIGPLSLNMFKPMNQLGMYAVGKLDREFAHHHLWRFMQIMDFLDAHTEKLLQDNYCRMSDGTREFCQPLLQALCTLPFSHRQLSETGHEERTFEINEVLTEVERLIEESD